MIRIVTQGAWNGDQKSKSAVKDYDKSMKGSFNPINRLNMPLFQISNNKGIEIGEVESNPLPAIWTGN